MFNGETKMNGNRKLLALACLVPLVSACGGDSDNDDLIIELPRAELRALHASPGAPDVDIRVNGELVLEDVSYQSASGNLSLAPGEYEVEVLEANTESVLLSETVELVDDDLISLLAANVPAELTDPENRWFGLTVRARTLVYSPERVDPSALSSYEALADKQWQGRVCIRSSSNVYNQSLVAAMLADLGAERTQQWANNLVTTFARPPAGGDRDQIRALAAGQCDLAVANTYYYGRMLKSDGEEKAAAEQVALFWPNQQGRGAHINVSGAGVTQSAKNKAAAIKLLEFLVSEPAQQWYAEVNNEFPVVEGVQLDPIVAAWGSFKADDVDLSTLGSNNQQAVKIMDRAGWR